MLFLFRKYRIGVKTSAVTFRARCIEVESRCYRLSYVHSLLFRWAWHGLWQKSKPIWSWGRVGSYPTYKNVMTFERLIALIWNFMAFSRIWLGKWQFFCHIFFWHQHFSQTHLFLPEKMVFLCSYNWSYFYILTLANLHYKLTGMFMT